MTLVQKEIKKVFLWTHQVRPVIPPLVYDFTTWTHWRTASSWTSRSSSGFYRTWTWTDGYISAPSEIFDNTPKKITISYNKTHTISGTWVFGSDIVNNSTFFPVDPSNLYTMQFNRNWTSNNAYIWGNPTWNVNWVMTIDSSTTPRTVTHKVGTLSTEPTEQYWLLNSLWSGEDFRVRIVQWDGWTWSIYITWVTIEY